MAPFFIPRSCHTESSAGIRRYTWRTWRASRSATSAIAVAPGLIPLTSLRSCATASGRAMVSVDTEIGRGGRHRGKSRDNVVQERWILVRLAAELDHHD